MPYGQLRFNQENEKEFHDKCAYFPFGQSNNKTDFAAALGMILM